MNESDVIRQYFAPLACPDLALGLKDDVGLLDPPAAGQRGFVTSDGLAEGVHFLATDPPRTIGRKLVVVNVSDVRAKGGRPVAASLHLFWPEHRGTDQLAEFAAGLGEELARHGFGLVGGDTVVHDGALCLGLTVNAECAEPGPVRRGGARPNDDVWVSGSIGDSYLGLRCARGELPEFSGPARERLIAHYRVPPLTPDFVVALIARHARASIDISDGLAIDADRLARASEVGLAIEVKTIPLSKEAHRFAERRPDGLLGLVGGGDDYQALFAAPPEARPIIERAAQAAGGGLTRIGRCHNWGSGAMLRSPGRKIDIRQTGFDHFRRRY